MAIIPNGKYDYDVSEKTITLLSPFDTLTIASINSVYDLDVNSMIYEFPMKLEGVTMAAGVITWTEDSGKRADADELRIEIDELSGAASISAYTESTNSISTEEISPLDGHILDDIMLDAVTATATSTYVDCSGRGGFTVHVEASGATVNATINVNHTAEITSTDPAAVGLTDAGGTPLATPITLSTAGEYDYTFTNLATAKYVCSTATIVAGTITMTLLGRALGSE